MASALANIEHFIVVMLENRSFDNLLGFLYADDGNRPPLNLPPQDPPTFEGLRPNAFWNLTADAAPTKVFASCPTLGATPFRIPSVDPNELFANFNSQLFGSTANPADDLVPTMQGFLLDYVLAKGGSAAHGPEIMQSFSPQQLPVLSQLARNFAVCDAWFASVPAQTWPNRGFVHTGTSRGQVTNGNIFAYDTKTIYEVLQGVGASWAIYNNSILPTLAELQYPRLSSFRQQMHGFPRFKKDAQNGSLPRYAFVEPSFVDQPDDQHPPHDVALGEAFLWDVWTAVSSGPKWNQTLLVITHDEHGGCYDHVPPPWGP